MQINYCPECGGSVQRCKLLSFITCCFDNPAQVMGDRISYIEFIALHKLITLGESVIINAKDRINAPNS
jgi:hypothetical protein